jgi:hypothetical protein
MAGSVGLGPVSTTRSCLPPGAVRNESFTLPAHSPHQFAGLDEGRMGAVRHIFRLVGSENRSSTP